MSKKLSFFFFVISFTQGVFAQDFINTWFNEKNLPQNSVKSIAKDSLGFVWLATESGLARFDGKDFKIFGELKNLSTNRFNFFYNKNDSLYARTIYQEDVLITNNQIQKTKRRKFSKIELPIKHEFISEKIGHVLELNQTTSYILPKSEKQLFLKHNELERSFSFNNEISSVINFKDQIYVITERNFFKISLNEAKLIKIDLLNPLNTENKELKKEKKINYIFDFNQKAIYLNLNKEVYHYCIKKDELTIIHNQLNFKEKNIITAYYDASRKTSYFGSGYKGFLVSRPNLFSIYKAETPYYVQNLIYAFDVINKDKIITSRGLLFDINTKQVENLNYVNSLNSLSMEKIDDYRYAQILHKSIVIIDYTTKNEPQKIFKFKDDLGVLHYSKKNNLIYFSTKKFNSKINTCLYTYNFKTQAIKKIATTKRNVNIIDQYDENQLYLGTENGAYILNLNKNELKLIEGTFKYNVRAINFQHNYAWISTYNKGLILKKGNRFYEFPVITEKVSKSVHHAIEDDYGYLWISTNNGLLRGKVKRLLNTSSDEAHFFNYFGTDEGLLTSEFNGGCKPCATKLESGEILFPSLNGIVKLNPSDFLYLDDHVENITSTVFINDQKFESVDLSGNLFFSKNTQKIKFEFDYVKSNSVFDFKYRLNDGIVSEITNNEITLNNLAPEDYTLRLFLPDYPNKIKINFSINPKFYQTFQFKLLVLFLIAVLVYFMAVLKIAVEQKRRKYLNNLVKEKTSLLKDAITNLTEITNYLENKITSQKKTIALISHDIRSPLQYIKLSTKYLESELASKNLGPKVEENISSLNEAVTKLQAFTDHILTYSKATLSEDRNKSETFNLYDLVKEKAELFEQVVNLQKNHLEIDITKDFYINSNKNLLAIIIHNILDNALKNTSRGSVKLSAKKIAQKIIFKIEDTGNGMNKETLNKYRSVFENTKHIKQVSEAGLGLFMVAEAAELIKGNVEIESEKNKGTQFYLVIKQ